MGMSPSSLWTPCPLVKAASKLEGAGDGRRAMQPLRLLRHRPTKVICAAAKVPYSSGMSAVRASAATSACSAPARARAELPDWLAGAAAGVVLNWSMGRLEPLKLLAQLVHLSAQGDQSATEEE